MLKMIIACIKHKQLVEWNRMEWCYCCQAEIIQTAHSIFLPIQTQNCPPAFNCA